jgi:hypothetical protein
MASKHLSLGIELWYFATGTNEGLREKRERAAFAYCLPTNRTHLCIRGYKKGLDREHYIKMQVLKSHYDSGLLNLKELTGIDELILNGGMSRIQ